MAIENVELMHECFAKQFPIAAARMKQNTEAEVEGKMRRGIRKEVL